MFNIVISFANEFYWFPVKFKGSLHPFGAYFFIWGANKIIGPLKYIKILRGKFFKKIF